jgi:hypothetical protein
MDQFIQVLGAPLTAAPVQDLIARFRLVENPSSPEHFNSPSLGIALRVDDRRAVDTVFLFGNGKDDFREYRGSLPGALTFRHGRSEVRRVYGEPTSSANATTAAQGGYQHGGWDRYDLPTHVLHFSYERAVGVIELVTLMAARQPAAAAIPPHL